jgi:signal transduction histidine kinase/ActR/RegA family two-component response regulator
MPFGEYVTPEWHMSMLDRGMNGLESIPWNWRRSICVLPSEDKSHPMRGFSNRVAGSSSVGSLVRGVEGEATMTVREIDPVPLQGKRVLLAWHPAEDGPELEQLRDQLESAGAAVETARKIGDIKHHLDVARTTGDPPEILISHLRFPEIHASGLNRWMKARVGEDHGGKELLTVVVATRILGADFDQFCIDIDADQMILMSDVEQEIISRVKYGLQKQSEPRQSPVYYVHSKRQDLVKDLEHRMQPHQQLVPFIERERVYPRIWNEGGGMLLIDEDLLEELNQEESDQQGNKHHLDNIATKLGMGIVVLLDEDLKQKMEDPETRAMHWLRMGASDCLAFDTSAEEIARRCNCARRNRARDRLEMDLESEISRIEINLRGRKTETKGVSRLTENDDFFHSPSAAFLIHDRSGHIKRANSKAAIMFGFSIHELEHMRIGKLHPGGLEMTEERKMNFEAFLKAGKVKFETRFIKKNQSSFMGVVNARFIVVEELAGDEDLILTEIHSLDQHDLISKTLPDLITTSSEELNSRIQEAIREVIRELGEGTRQEANDYLAGISVYKELEDGFECAFQEGFQNFELQINATPRRRDVADIVQWFKSGNSTLDSTRRNGPQLTRLFHDFQGFEFFAIPLWFRQEFIGFSVVALKTDPSLSVNNYHRKRTSRILMPIVNIIAAALHRKDEDEIRKILEDRSTQQDKNDALDNITEGICHDYNNLLTAISAHASLLLRGKGLDGQMIKSLEGIRGAADRGSGLSKKIRDRSKPSQIKATFNLHDKVKEVVNLMGVVIDPKITIQQDLQAGRDSILGDSGLAHQVLMNLIINASQAMAELDQPGTITVRSRVKKKRSQYSSDMIEVSIEDEGPGIESRLKLKIFEPYFTTKDSKVEGAGLGLWVVHNAMKKHGGSIRLGNDRAHGACFITEWPLTDELEKADNKKMKPLFKGTGRILLVDDDEAVMEACRILLNTIGFDVVTACDGLKALEMYEQKGEAIDLVLLDQRMPKMAGDECLERLIQLDPEIRVVMTSGNDLNSKQIVESENVVGILPKPYTIEVLSKVLEEATLDHTV